MKKTSYGLEHTPTFEASRYDIERSPGNYIKRLSEEIDWLFSVLRRIDNFPAM